MTLTEMAKHVRMLEAAQLVATKKVGRVRLCSRGPRRLDAEAGWISRVQTMWEARYDRLEAFLERIFDSPRERVWRAFTEPDLAAQW